MAVYRNVHIEFWQDGFILDLTPEEKYFYIYLMTNSKTSQCGIYELPKRIIETETGYNRETVEKLLKRFEEYGKIIYCDETKEIFLKNWIKHNKAVSPQVVRCIEKELLNIKSKDLIDLFSKECDKYNYVVNIPNENEIGGMDTVSIPLGYPRHTVCQGYGEKEKQKEKIKEKEKIKGDKYEQNRAFKKHQSTNTYKEKNDGVTYQRPSKEQLDELREIMQI